jgi:hypothetical protein
MNVVAAAEVAIGAVVAVGNVVEVPFDEKNNSMEQSRDVDDLGSCQHHWQIVRVEHRSVMTEEHELKSTTAGRGWTRDHTQDCAGLRNRTHGIVRRRHCW